MTNYLESILRLSESPNQLTRGLVFMFNLRCFNNETLCFRENQSSSILNWSFCFLWKSSKFQFTFYKVCLSLLRANRWALCIELFPSVLWPRKIASSSLEPNCSYSNQGRSCKPFLYPNYDRCIKDSVSSSC